MQKDRPILQSNFLDRAIGYLAPATGLRRMAARTRLQQIRSFEGASKGRRTKNWKATSADINSILAGGLPTLRARIRDLERNNPWVAKAVGVIESNVVGPGITPHAKDKRLEELWIRWGDEVLCDADERLDFYAMQALAIRTIVTAGSVLIRRRRRRASDGLPVPMQLQVLEPDFLDTTKDGLTKDGNIILGGVEFNKLGRRLGYWLYAEHPGGKWPALRGLQSNFVPAADIIHVYRTLRPGQVDGVPWGSSCILRVRDLDEYEDAQLMRQKIAACFVAFVHDKEALETASSMTQAQKDALAEFEPGMLEYLPPGKEITFGSPPPVTGYDVHTTMVLRSVSCAFDITYESLTNDYSKVNFSSGRMGWLEMNRSVTKAQNHMMIPLLCKGVWRWFHEAAVLAGKASEDALPAVWATPKREMIDPVKETEALKSQVRSGFKTFSEALRENGKDPEKHLAEMQADNKALDKAGLVLDSDPRRSSGSAALPPPPKEEEEGEAPEREEK